MKAVIPSLFRKIVSLFGKLVSLSGKLVQKLRLLMPRKKTHDVLPRGRKANKIQEYYYIKYTTGALRVIAWIVLVLGFISSLVLGISTGGIKGGLLTVLVIIGSFLAWLLLLAAGELLKLLMDVKENTRGTAEGITEKSR